ncbi:alpha-1,3-mannosyl-glycoprotein 4-beta-N-acetylglucosaminyltransferase A isoform X2 [Aricia agestis]|nr:alpha-1,3-mannosyl-glycoprotein 4-beta-N-acetylglucosaminyltransferase A isoform X2 [Aricia agestis]
MAPTGRGCCGCALPPRRRITAGLVIFFVAIVISFTIFGSDMPRLPREDEMEEHIAEMQSHLMYLESMYRNRQEDILALQAKVSGRNFTRIRGTFGRQDKETPVPPHITALIKNLNGTRAATGLKTKSLTTLQAPVAYRLLPHLMNDVNSLKPAYHMKSSRLYTEYVIGIPTVKRDKESYLLICLTHLVGGLTEADEKNILMIVFVGETDLEYVINTAHQIESMFPKQVASGLIEVMSPSASYYPDLDAIPLSLGDSQKRVKWRTKQNLDAIYLMSYAQSKGTFYLMLEDDVIARKNYMQDVKKFTAATTVTTPKWFILSFCNVGGIGKLFRSSDLVHFIYYMELFYGNMPIDWLIESFLADRICSMDKSSEHCGKSKLQIRPRYKTPLFQHIGLYSSLKGKIQKVKDPSYGTLPAHYAHDNPPLRAIHSNIMEHADHTAKRAYEGHTFFWGVKPKKGDVLEFWFEKPTEISSFLFRSSNFLHPFDKFYESVVEVLPVAFGSNFTMVHSFDEFGLADGELKRSMGPFSAIRIRVNKDSPYWVLLSEIEVKTFDKKSTS